MPFCCGKNVPQQVVVAYNVDTKFKANKKTGSRPTSLQIGEDDDPLGVEMSPFPKANKRWHNPSLSAVGSRSSSRRSSLDVDGIRDGVRDALYRVSEEITRDVGKLKHLGKKKKRAKSHSDDPQPLSDKFVFRKRSPSENFVCVEVKKPNFEKVKSDSLKHPQMHFGCDVPLPVSEYWPMMLTEEYEEFNSNKMDIALIVENKKVRDGDVEYRYTSVSPRVNIPKSLRKFAGDDITYDAHDWIDYKKKEIGFITGPGSNSALGNWIREHCRIYGVCKFSPHPTDKGMCRQDLMLKPEVKIPIFGSLIEKAIARELRKNYLKIPGIVTEFVETVKKEHRKHHDSMECHWRRTMGYGKDLECYADAQRRYYLQHAPASFVIQD